MNKHQIKINQVIEELTSYIEGLFNNREDTLGLSIALTNETEILWAQGFGYTDYTRNKRVTAETLFSSQSIGKCFTATAFLILASKGLVNLDYPIKRYFPEFTINTIHGNPEDEISKITFRRMLNHRAGLTHEALVGNNYDYNPCTFEEHIQSIKKGWLKSHVGSEMSYSNLGYDLTGYIMGLIRNKSFKEVMSEELFLPLEITNATYDIEIAQKKSFAKGFDGLFAYPTIQIPMLGAGGLFISVLDAAKLVLFHLRKGRVHNKQLIKPKLLEEMYKPQFIKGKEFGYGIGLYSTEKKENAIVYGHSGGGYGYQTIMLWILDFKIGVVVLSNNMKQSRVGSIARKALELMIKDMGKIGYKPVLPEKLKRLEGTYCADGNLGPQLIRVACENEKLFLYYTSGTRIELFSHNMTEFSSNDGTKYSFELNNQGQPISIYIDDAVFPYKAKYNDGPNDILGPALNEWQEYLGIYQFEDEARPSYLGLGVINDYLYLIFKENLKLHHHKDNLYFTADGEALLLSKGELNYKGIHSKKVVFDINHFIENIAQNKVKIDFYSNAVSCFVNIIYYLQGFKQTINFIEKVIQIDEEFKGNFIDLGKRLFSLGKIEEAKICFTKSLNINPENREVKEILEQIKQIQE